MITACRCGAFKLLTATGVRFEENAGAICRHGVEACRWFAEFPSEVATGSRAPSVEEGPRPYDMSIHQNRDAAAWAQAFVQTWGYVYPNQPAPSEGWMLGWFANAMMAMHDTSIDGRARPAPSPEAHARCPEPMCAHPLSDHGMDGRCLLFQCDCRCGGTGTKETK